MGLAFYLACSGLAVAAFATIGARSLVRFSPHRLQELCKKAGREGRMADILRHHQQLARAAAALRILATSIALVAIVFFHGEIGATTNSTMTVSPWNLLWPGTLWLFVLFAAEIWIPQAVVRLWATPILYHTWPFWKLLGVLLWPLALLGEIIDTFISRLAGNNTKPSDEEAFEEDIKTIVTAGHREGFLQEDAREMIEGVIELDTVEVSEVMTPRTDMVSIPKSLSWSEMLRFVIDDGHSRFPITEKNRDDVIGVLVTKDLLSELAVECEPEQSWDQLIRTPYFVPETKKIDQLLEEFQETRNHIAIVLDEYGGVAGLVTLEDVLEEIVGEIVDEHDEELVEDIRMVEEGICEALGKAHVDEINEAMGLQLPEDEDFDTIAGLVFSGLGHIPVVGEQLVKGDALITVLEASRRRIERVRIEIRE